MKTPLISIVVPAYNAQKHLSSTIDSILAQTYKNIEIIIVNDGSTDKTKEICNFYKKSNEHIKVIHKKNGGLSAARKSGLKKANGEYITFIDSDDTIEQDCIEYLYDLLSVNTADISICPYKVVDPTHQPKNRQIVSTEEILTPKEATKRMLINSGFSVSMCGKLYKTKILNDIIPSKNRLYEDNGITYKIFDKCKRIAYGNNAKYNYVVHKDSITTSIWTPQKMDLIILTDEMCDFVDKKYPDLKDCTKRRRIECRLATLRQALFSKEYAQSTEINEIIDYVKLRKNWILSNKYSSKRDKAGMLSLLIGKNCFKQSWKAYTKLRRIS